MVWPCQEDDRGPSLLHSGYQVFPGVESSWGVTLTPHTYLVLRPKNRVEYTFTLPKGLRSL
jgi:hypothetical protein